MILAVGLAIVAVKLLGVGHSKLHMAAVAADIGST